MKISVVVPTIRETSILRFLKEWYGLFKHYRVNLIVVEDNPDKTFDIDSQKLDLDISHYSWSDIDRDLGKDSWIISRRSSAIKSYGFWKAYRQNSDMIVSFDDDCYPLSNYLEGINPGDYFVTAQENLFNKIHNEVAWESTMKGVKPRGLPYKNLDRVIPSNRVILNHGLWANVPDLDAETQIATKRTPKISSYFKSILIPRGVYFPMCGMNLAWKRDLTPAMYFMLMGKDRNGKSWGYNRFDDIWAGLFVKKICDHLNYRIISGYPVIWHDRASNVRENFKKEKSGRKINEKMWKSIDKVDLQSNNIKDSYKELAREVKLGTGYFKKLTKAMQIWVSLF